MKTALSITLDAALVAAISKAAEQSNSKVSPFIADILRKHLNTNLELYGIEEVPAPDPKVVTRKSSKYISWKSKYRIWMAKTDAEAARIARIMAVDDTSLKEIRAGLNPASEVYEKEFGVTLANWEHYQQWRGELNKSLGIQP